jgi:two-component system chemotaxis response regulator CheY
MATVLVIDDALVMRKCISKIITTLGHQVVGEGKSGEEAVAKFKELAPDIVTMDITMDGMDGITATKKILEEYPDAKIIICSSHANDASKQEAMSIGALAYITKPLVEADILAAFNKVI